MSSKTTIRVRYKETDQMGIVYYSNYFVWFEVARSEFLRKLGNSYKELEKKGMFMPVIEAHCKYKSPAFYDDEIMIKTWAGEFTGVRITLYYEVYRKTDEKLLVEGFTVHAFTDDKGKPVTIKKTNPEIYRTIENYIAKSC